MLVLLGGCQMFTPSARQVSAYFHWLRYLHHRMPAGKELVFVNLAETSIGYSFARMRGNVVRKKYWPKGVKMPAESINKSELRGSISQMAFLNHRSDFQPRLPQILVGNKRRFTLPLLRSVSGSTPGNVHLFPKAV